MAVLGLNTISINAHLNLLRITKLKVIKRIGNTLTMSAFCLIAVGCVHGTGGGGDAKDNVVITSSNQFSYGPLKTSCTGLAMLYTQNREVYSQGGSWGSKPKPLNPNSDWAGVRVMDWTPSTVQFLEGAVDTCVEENTYSKNLGRHLTGSRDSSYFNMSPSGTKELIQQTYVLVEDAKRSQRQAQENFKIKEVQKLQRAQDLKAGTIPVGNLQDAATKLDASDASEVIRSPKIKPDGKNYKVGGYLEKYTESTFIATTVPAQVIGSIPFNTRFVVLVPQAFQGKYQNTARVGGGIGLVGRYVGNRNLDLVMGNSVTVPVFEMLYMSQ